MFCMYCCDLNSHSTLVSEDKEANTLCPGLTNSLVINQGVIRFSFLCSGHAYKYGPVSSRLKPTAVLTFKVTILVRDKVGTRI
jgi:hypothetical protein